MADQRDSDSARGWLALREAGQGTRPTAKSYLRNRTRVSVAIGDGNRRTSVQDLDG